MKGNIIGVVRKNGTIEGKAWSNWRVYIGVAAQEGVGYDILEYFSMSDKMLEDFLHTQLNTTDMKVMLGKTVRPIYRKNSTSIEELILVK